MNGGRYLWIIKECGKKIVTDRLLFLMERETENALKGQCHPCVAAKIT